MRARIERADRGRGSVPGLQVRVDSRGRISHRLRHRMRGQQLSITWHHVSLAEARKRAWRALADVSRGEDPQRARPQKPLTVRRCAALWVLANRRRWRRRTTLKYIEMMRLHLM